jgi:hypothetical protein
MASRTNCILLFTVSAAMRCRTRTPGKPHDGSKNGHISDYVQSHGMPDFPEELSCIISQGRTDVPGMPSLGAASRLHHRARSFARPSPKCVAKPTTPCEMTNETDRQTWCRTWSEEVNEVTALMRAFMAAFSAIQVLEETHNNHVASRACCRTEIGSGQMIECACLVYLSVLESIMVAPNLISPEATFGFSGRGIDRQREVWIPVYPRIHTHCAVCLPRYPSKLSPTPPGGCIATNTQISSHLYSCAISTSMRM